MIAKKKRTSICFSISFHQFLNKLYNYSFFLSCLPPIINFNFFITLAPITMLRSIIKSFKPSASFSSSIISPKSTTSLSTSSLKPLTVYHNSNLLVSHQLVAKLNNFNSTTDSPTNNKITFNLKTNEQLSESDYKFIIDECLYIHPDNKSILLQIFHNKYHMDKKKLIKDFTLHDSIFEYNNLINNNKSYPLIIDYNHCLIANDDASFDRIMMNYLTCGIQNTTSSNSTTASHGFTTNGSSSSSGNGGNNSTGTVKYNDLVHPHMAEFADLF